MCKKHHRIKHREETEVQSMAKQALKQTLTKKSLRASERKSPEVVLLFDSSCIQKMKTLFTDCE